MTAIQSNNQNLYFPYNSSRKDEKHEAIQKLVKTTFKELAVGLAFAGVACLFCSNPAGIVLALGSVVGMVAINAIFRGIAHAEGKLLHKIERCKTPEAEKQKKASKAFIEVCNAVQPVAFATVFAETAGILIHEIGHALASLILFAKPNLSISINPWKNGVTNWTVSQLSKIGSFFGLKEAKLIVAAAGTLLILATSIGLFVAAHFLKDKHPKACQYMNMIGIMDLAVHIQYVISGLVSTDPSNDFGALKAGGISPYVSLAALVGLPLFIKGMLVLVDYLRKHTHITLPPLKTEVSFQQPLIK